MKTKNILPVLTVMISVLMLAGCYQPWHHVEGNNDVETETRQLAPFERIVNEGNFEVYIFQDGLNEVVVEAESNLIPLIRTRLEGSALVIDTQDDLRNNEPMKIFVHTEEVEEIQLSGSGYMEALELTTGDLQIEISGSGDILYTGTSQDVECQISGSGAVELDLSCNNLEIDISGSGDIKTSGTANKGDFHISGSGDINGYDLLLQECEARISGSGSIYLSVEDYLNVNISGSGDVYYLGNPEVDADISGSGSVIHP